MGFACISAQSTHRSFWPGRRGARISYKISQKWAGGWLDGPVLEMLTTMVPTARCWDMAGFA
jgi:hypothetical protein